MPQVPPQFEEIPEWVEIARKLIEKHPDRFSHIEPEWLVAYIVTNKTKPESKDKLYDIAGDPLPQSLTNSKKYFITIFHDVWEALPDKNKNALVFAALRRIDRENPESGKVRGYDLHDDSLMARTFGVDWALKSDIPDVLEDDIDFKDEPIVS